MILSFKKIFNYYLTVLLAVGNFTTTIATNTHSMTEQKIQKATFAGGCFWCTEAVFLELKGVKSVRPGYIGGFIKNPSYEAVCTGTTGHAEAIEIVFDSNQISYYQLLEVFFATHNPTTLNRQGADVGTQYRSEIFFHSESQKKIVTEVIKKLNDSKVFEDKIVTQLSKASVFYEAEDYHKNYYNRNKNQSYCKAVISPKMEKLKKLFSNFIRN